MKIIIDNIDTNEIIVLEHFDISSRIIDLKIHLKTLISYNIDSIQLVTFNNQNICDSSSVKSYVLLDETQITFKLKQDKSILTISIEIYDKFLENLSMELSYSTSIYLLKKLIEFKTKIPIEEQLIYLNNSKLQDADTFQHMILKNSLNRQTRSPINEQTLSTGDISSPRVTKLKLLRKNNKGLCLGLDFSFNYMKNLQKMNWDNIAPSFREIEDGLSIICYCMNENCKLYNQMFVENLGKRSCHI